MIISPDKNAPYWYKLLHEWVNIQENSGLSIPFLIGAESILSREIILDDNSIRRLFDSVINHRIQNRCVTIKYCNTISAYILGLENTSEIKEPFFNDSNGTPSLAILNNTFGRNQSLTQIIEFLEGEYLECILSGKYSRQNNAFGEWGAFSASDLEFINLSNS